MRAHFAAVIATTALLIPIGPALADDPGWGQDRIDQRNLPLDGSYTPVASGVGVTAYLIDTGLDTANSQFGGRATLGANFTGTSVTDCADEQGVSHGTFVAGIVGGNQTGVANQVKLVELQALGCTEGGSTMTVPQQRRAVVKALKWVRTNGVRPAVVNMSLTFNRSRSIDRAVNAVLAAGFPVVAASGNQGADACAKSPAHLPGVITVAASTRKDKAWKGSNQGSCVDIWAPGKDITSVLAGEGVIRYEFVGATSWAAPFVTGAVAQRLQSNPTETPGQVRRWVRSTATRGVLSGVRSGTTNRLLYVGP